LTYIKRLPHGALEFLAVLGGFAALTIALTYPLAFNLGLIGYKLHVAGDPQYSVWNVAWVAHALTNDPLNVFNANIFFPHSWTLIYSEANLMAGALGAPVYWLTRNAYATHNFVVLSSFVLSAIGTYYLVRYLVNDRRAAVVGALCFAYCPYVFGHLPHIQLLMTAGIPFSLLAFHRLADRPSPLRGVALGTAMGLQGLACAYYAVFLALVIGIAVFVTAAWRKTWADRRYWLAIAVAATVAIAVVAPLFLPYVVLQRDTGFGRALEQSRRWSANWLSYATSAMYASSWLHAGRTGWTDVLFPGLLATIFGLVGIMAIRRTTGIQRYYVALYAVIAGFALWESFGPKAGLYTLTYYTVPAFTFLRAPSRFGILVTFGLAIIAAITFARLLERSRRATLLATASIALGVVESSAPVPWTPNPPIAPVYHYLADLPRAALIEFPLYSKARNFMRTRYMVASTVHWKPLVNAYSDLTPAAFDTSRDVLASFPSNEAFARMPEGVRYAIFHVEEYRKNNVLAELEGRLTAFSPHLKRVFADDTTWLYEIDAVSAARLRRSPSTKIAGR
jgi:hypothetical protein